MTVSEFVRKWRSVELTERSASHEHFLDLCETFEHPTPAEADPTGEWFTFERGAEKHGGGEGWADVWKRGFFGWEYKGKKKDLDAAYDQLLKYRESLESPPLLIVCDMDRFVIHTNFTATAPKVHDIALKDLGQPRNVEIMRCVFHAPDKLKPGVTSEAITTEAAGRIADIARRLRKRNLDPVQVARFLDRIVFCLFAEDVGLLPESLFTKSVEKSSRAPARFSKLVAQLFHAMAKGGDFGLETIRHFNGNLFGDDPVLELTEDELGRIVEATRLDWSAVDPSIFGTLFERGLDPDKRSQLGAHYTSRQDIETLVEPVVMQPLRREWAEVKGQVESALAPAKPSVAGKSKRATPAAAKRTKDKAGRVIRDFLIRLREVTVLDPACGSGNFLYVTLQKLKDLEKEVLVFSDDAGLGLFLPRVGPWQLYGIEINRYAHDLAQMAVWIGYLQWTRANGFGIEDDPILRPLDNFQCMDAVLDLSDPEHPKEPAWPKVEFIVSNPPFLGGKLQRATLSDSYVDAMFRVWDGRVPREADYCCYWFEKARRQIEHGACKRAGLIATQGIRGGANREVLKRIKETGDIFFAESDRDWILDGANVHVSMIGFDAGTEIHRTLDGSAVATINPNLTAHADITEARRLAANLDIAFMGTTKGGPFDIPEALATALLRQPNPHGRPNSDVVVPWVNGMDLTKRPSGTWIIDFGVAMELNDAAGYEAAFEYVREHVKPKREESRTTIEEWWLHERRRGEMRAALGPLPRFICTTRVSKHRLFVWLRAPTLPDSATFVFARDDDYFFGVLHSRLHEIWALRLGTRLETRPRYTPTTCFETFPFPNPAPAQQAAIAEAAKELDARRANWLNPPEWTREEVLEFPGSADGPWAKYVHGPDSRAIGTVRYPRVVPKDADCAKQLAKRTLTNLYNKRDTWLDLAHKKLDETVFAAYGWNPGMSDEDILAKLLALNLEHEPA